jgi:four helix bundle protein
MGQVNSYRDLLVWEQAIDLATAIYKCMKSWPKEELYGLTQPVRRAAVSVPANIAEGNGRELRAPYINFLRISQGSLKEVETHLIIAHRVGVADQGEVKQLLERCESIGKLLRLLIPKLGEAQSAD